MTADIIRPRAFQRGPAVRSVHPVDEALAILRLAELRSGVNAVEANADELERLHEAVVDLVGKYERGVL